MHNIRGAGVPLFLLFALPLWAQQYTVRQTGSIALNGVNGRIDHFSYDAAHHRLFMSALGNHTIEVMDTLRNTRLHTIPGLAEPQGVLYVPRTNRIFAATAGDGKVRVYDGASYKLMNTIHLGSDADNLRYDAPARQVVVGYGDGALAFLDESSGQMVRQIPLPAHPESFQLEPGGGSIFINLPDARHTIAVADQASGKITATWSLKPADNFPMALDTANHRLFVVCRHPAQLVVLDAVTGSQVAELSAPGDADDIYYDAGRKLILISGGEGKLVVIQQLDASHYRALQSVGTAPGARTSCYIADLNRLYVAVPHRGDQNAALLIFQINP